MLQVLLSKDLLFDLQNYADENGLKYTDVVRHLIRTEIYQKHTLAKLPPDTRKGKIKHHVRS